MPTKPTTSFFNDPAKLQGLSQFLLSFGAGAMAAGNRGLGIGAGIGMGFLQGGAGLTAFQQQEERRKGRELQRKALEQRVAQRKAAVQKQQRLGELTQQFITEKDQQKKQAIIAQMGKLDPRIALQQAQAAERRKVEEARERVRQGLAYRAEGRAVRREKRQETAAANQARAGEMLRTELARVRKDNPDATIGDIDPSVRAQILTLTEGKGIGRVLGNIATARAGELVRVYREGW